MSTVTLAEDVLDPTSWETYQDVDVIPFLRSRYSKFPNTGRIYLKYVAHNCDVTPHSEDEVTALAEMDGHFYVMIYPEGFEVIAIIVAIVLAAVAIGLAFLLRPNTNPSTNQQSPNNRLNNRSNSARPNERIPDIEGEVRSIPDEIAPDYKIFEGNQEVEYSYLCVGRGQYEIGQTVSTSLTVPVPVWDIKEDTTPVQEIAGESVEVYGPNTSPNKALVSGGSADVPQLSLGTPIATPVYTVQPSASVNGQICRPPNDQNIIGNNNIRATASGTIESNDTNIDLTAYFADRDNISFTYTGASDPGGTHSAVDLSGFYTILTVTSNTITLANPNAVNANWSALSAFTGAASNYQSPQIAVSGSKWIGPFILNVENMTEVWCNFVAPNGLFKISSTTGVQYKIDVDVIVGIQAIDGSNQPIGAEIFFTGKVIGSAVLQSQRGLTVKCVLPLAGSCQVRVSRVNLTDNTWQGTNADQVQWRDLYAVTYPTQAHFGNVTTIQTKTFATASALSVQSRKFNLLVTRKIPTKVNPTDLKPTPTNLNASTNIADIVCAIAKDPFIGNRSDAEIDFATIYDVLGPGGEVETYFGTDLCTRFGYTFDDSNISFEEMLGDIAQACFCQFYREGSLLSVYFEKKTDVPTLLFNHRNKMPKSETRTVTFGYISDYDGIELEYVDPNAANYPDIDTKVSLYFPTDRSAVNAKKVTLIGVRNNVQAAMIGWRLYMKLLYQNTVTEFKATKEARTLVLSNKIMVADNTRDDVMDGYVVGVNALELTLSQPVTFASGKTYSIFIQHTDATVESISITPGSTPYKVVLGSAPAAPIQCDPKTWSQGAKYLISLPDSDPAAQRTANFLVSEKKYDGNQTFAISATNYDERYYSHDQDFATGVLTYNGTAYNGNGGYLGGGGTTGGGGTGATFSVNSFTEFGSGTHGFSYTYTTVTSIDVISGGSGYLSTVQGVLEGNTFDPTTGGSNGFTSDPVILDVTSGVITFARDTTSDLQWDGTPSFSFA